MCSLVLLDFYVAGGPAVSASPLGNIGSLQHLLSPSLLLLHLLRSTLANSMLDCSWPWQTLAWLSPASPASSLQFLICTSQPSGDPLLLASPCVTCLLWVSFLGPSHVSPLQLFLTLAWGTFFPWLLWLLIPKDTQQFLIFLGRLMGFSLRAQRPISDWPTQLIYKGHWGSPLIPPGFPLFLKHIFCILPMVHETGGQDHP